MESYRIPKEGEYNPYYKQYVDLVGTADVIGMLKMSSFELIVFLEGLSDEKWEYRYAAGKWTIKETMLHLIDAERVFCYRALRIARNDQTPMPGFDQDAYVVDSFAAERQHDSIIEEYRTARNATVSLFEGFHPSTRHLLGTASNSPVTVNALAYIIAGHQAHHLDLFKAKYL